ncbi:monovalent cation/H+ antiporter subunit D family protein [Terasakiella sp. A23]|uniref:monovalent cation/H+ antiporter subunit D family protein n=1 Tax=Terasakiella sp. FCG-A23 TaxID=3080561 RepID=UPI002955871D|nr:monovalent cation/H+ antiporter subunit D family protein [Terasakiella sp. A23]MDV7338795.1 monovalent cation/H+ antiporter subunit D family protein [Terasakiella sp. A23]
MSAHLPVLQIIIPLMAAPLCVVFRHRDIAWLIALIVSLVCFGISLMILDQVLTQGVLSYFLGGWPAPWGIEFRIDVVNAYVLVIVAAIGAIVSLYGRHSVTKEIPQERIYLFYTAYLLCLCGLLGMTATGDAFNLFVFLEVSSLSTYAMISLGKDRRALTASYQYLIMGTLGATFYVIGLGLLYMMTGTLNIADLHDKLADMDGSIRTLQAALAFLTVGLSLKLALFPLHLWLPNAYTYAPSTVTAFLAATATKVAVYVMLRVFFTIFGVDIFEETALADVLMVLAIAGMFVASTVAIFQDNMKRMLAYSSVAQIGYIMLGISLLNVTGVSAGIVHLLNHAIMKSACFLAVGCIVYRMGTSSLSELSGVGKTMPWTMGAFVVGGMSLIGVPLTVGFISKWQLISAAMQADMMPVAVLILLSSLLAVIYVWRVIEIAYFRAPANGTGLKEAPLSMLIPLWVMAGASVYFGVDTGMTLGVAEIAAEMLVGGAP